MPIFFYGRGDFSEKKGPIPGFGAPDSWSKIWGVVFLTHLTCLLAQSTFRPTH